MKADALESPNSLVSSTRDTQLQELSFGTQKQIPRGTPPTIPPLKKKYAPHKTTCNLKRVLFKRKPIGKQGLFRFHVVLGRVVFYWFPLKAVFETVCVLPKGFGVDFLRDRFFVTRIPCY